MRNFFKIIAALLCVGVISTPGASAPSIRVKPAPGALETAIVAVAAKDRGAFRASAAKDVGKLQPWTYTRNGTTWYLEMRQPPLVDPKEPEVLIVFVRASVGGQVRGLGPRRVEWERIRISRPPLKVPDGTFHEEIIGGETVLIDNFVEDPAAALRLEIGHTVSLIDSGLSADPGTEGHTTSTFYPDANPESATVDGTVYYSATSSTFDTARNWTLVTNVVANDSGASFSAPRLLASTTTDQFQNLGRGFYLFNTAAIPDGDAIASVTLSLYGLSKQSNLGDTSVEVVAAAPASNTALAVGDYDAVTFSSFGSLASIAGAATGAYNDIALNGSGIAAVSKTGITKYGTVTGWDLNNSFGGTWVSAANTGLNAYFADQAGTTNDPKMTAVHSAPGGPGPMLSAPF